jgi:acylphosphatase
VRNCADGSVEALLSGSEPAVAELVERLRRGPPGASVATLEATAVAPAPLTGFAIRRG